MAYPSTIYEPSHAPESVFHTQRRRTSAFREMSAVGGGVCQQVVHRPPTI